MRTTLRLSILIIIISFFCNSLKAQSPGWAWSRSYGNTGNESVNKVVSNSAGQVFAYGTFDGPTLPVSTTTLTSAGARDLFLIAHDTSGTFQWAIAFGGNGSSEVPGSMSSDGSGNVVVTGSFRNAITIGTNTLVSAGDNDIFVAKIHRATGAVLWAKRFGGTGNDSATAVKCDPSGNIYMAGKYTNVISIGGAILPSDGAYNSFYGKLDGSGDALWAKKISDGGYFILNIIDFPGNNQVSFFAESGGQESITLVPGIAPPLGLSPDLIPCRFFLKTDGSGSYVSQHNGGFLLRFTHTSGVAIAPDKELYFSGSRSGLESLRRAFIVRATEDNVTTNNVFAHGNSTVNSSTSYGSDIVFGKNNRLFTLGNHFGTVDFTNGFSIDCAIDEQSYFIWEVDTALNTKGLLHTPVLSIPRVNLYSLAADTLANSLFTGGTIQPLPGGLALGPDTLLPRGGSDILISKISINGYYPYPYIELGRDTLLCAGNSVNIGNAAGTSSGIAPYNYSWYPVTGLANPDAPFTLATPAASQTYVLTVTDAAGHIYRDSIHITVAAAPPTPAITASGPLTFCNPGNITLTSSVAAGSYVWNTGETTQAISIANSGTYLVKDSTAPGCVSQFSLPVVVTVDSKPAVPSITVTGKLPFCAGSGGSVTLSSTASEPGDTYLWTNGATTQSITVNETDPAASYRVLIKRGSCYSEWSNTITAYSTTPPLALTVTANGPTTFCQGGSVTLTALAGHYYKWNTGSTMQSITVTSSGTYWVADSVAGNDCRSIPAYITVAVHPAPPTPVITSGTGSFNFCQGNTIGLIAPDAASYLWSTGATTKTILVTASGNYTVKVMGAGCESPVSAPAIVTATTPPGLLAVSASGPLSFCEGNSVTLTATAGHNYVWSNGATTAAITVVAGGSYTVKDSISGCPGPSSVPAVVMVTPLPPTPFISANQALSFCEGGNVILTSSAAHSYLWSNGASTQSITVTSGGSFFVKDSDQGCSSAPSSPVSVTVKPLPNVPVITQNDNVLRSSAATGNQWYYNGTIIPGATGNQYTYSSPGSYSVTVTNVDTCSVASAGYSARLSNGTITTLRNGDPFLHGLYPNPAQANSSVNFNLKSAATVSIVITSDNSMKVVEILKGQPMTSGDHRLSLGNHFYKLRSGFYIITYLINGEKVNEKFVVAK